jgi:integrase
MAGLRQRHNKWEAKVRVPGELVRHNGGRTFLYRTLTSGDKRAARAEADHWEAGLRAEWAALRGHDSPALSAIRAVYERTRRAAAGGDYEAHGGADDDAAILGVELEVSKLEDEVGDADLTPLQAAKLAGLQDALSDLNRQPVAPRRELEATFADLAKDYVDWWKRQGGLKGDTNTEQQKRATLDLFGGYWHGKPIRDVRQADAARFLDELRTFDPSWARSPANRELTWQALKRRVGGQASGLSDATMNRHSASLQAFWEWAAERDYCAGRNPFGGFRRRLRQGVNVRGYVAWELGELKRLFDPRPRRDDLAELMIVGMFTGMRLDEIASLTGSQVKRQDGVAFIQVEDAKTPAGNRQVPLHRQIAWLADRAKAAGPKRIWTRFNPEGPGKKAGADAGREFSRFKQMRGFTSRQKAFHSFRKNVTRIMERAGVPENEWAQVFGHERGFTYGRYNPDGITLKRKAEIIGLISYPGLRLQGAS